MSSTVTIPQGFQYVGAALLSTVYLLGYQSILVSRHRKAAGIPYPQLYAEKAEAEASKAALVFNCAQRAHQNTLENISAIYLLTIITGIKYPIPAACACGVWVLSRISYTRGYVTGVPKQRGGFLTGLGSVALIGQLLTSTVIAGGWVWSGLSKHL